MATYNGTSGNDFYMGTATADTIYGNGGDDNLQGRDGSDYIDGGAGNDYLVDNDGQTPDLYVDTLLGGDGNDSIWAGYGDNADGGNGSDALVFMLNYAPVAVNIDFTGLWFGGSATIGGGVIQHFETLTAAYGTAFNDVMISGTPAGMTGQLMGNAGSDTLTGGAGTDYLYAGPTPGSPAGLGADTDYDQLYGLGGNDNLYCGLGDYVDGGAGTDTLNFDVSNYGSGVSLYFVTLLSTGTDTLVGGTYVTGVETIGSVWGTPYNDIINAKTDTGNASLNGGAGDDLLRSGSGADYLNGGPGADAMNGGAGDDYYYVDDPGDTTTELAGGGNDRVDSTVSITLMANIEYLTLSGTAAINGTGNELANQLAGNGAANTLDGGAGNDNLQGFGGNDILIGGAGMDTMSGGTGADLFVFRDGDISGTGWGTADRIYDFSHAEGDLVSLAGIDAIAGGADDAFTFLGAAAFTGHAGELRYDINSGVTQLYGDTNGDGIADLSISFGSGFGTGVNLVAGDFIL